MRHWCFDLGMDLSDYFFLKIVRFAYETIGEFVVNL